MELPFMAHYQGQKYWEKVAPTPVGRGLRHGGEVASEAARYAHGNIPRAVAWAVPNALYTAAYIPLAAYSLVAKAYNAACGTQDGGRRYDNRHWYNHWKRLHLRPDDETNAPHLNYPGTAPDWGWVRDRVPGPDWHAPDYPAAPADPNVFDPNEKSMGMKDRSPVWRHKYIKYIAGEMLADAERLGHMIRTDVFPALRSDGTPHPQAGEPRFGNLSRVFQAAIEIEAIPVPEYSDDGSDNDAHDAAHDAARDAHNAAHNAQDAIANKIGFDDAAELLDYRDNQMYRIHSLQIMHYNNIAQMRFECEEAQETLDLIVKLHEKDLWYQLKWGYLNYESGHKSAAEKADSRLRGLLQEVDPLGGRRQQGPHGA